MSKIFLSYRRNDVPGTAGRLYDRLLEYFADDDVFLDVDSIEPGADFILALDQAVPNSAIVLVLMGKSWLDASDEQGKRKVDNPNDFVRAEVAAALAAGVRVIPVLVGEARMPSEGDLPEDMRQLSRLNAAHLGHHRFYADVEDLIAVIDHHLHGPATGDKPAPQLVRRIDSGTHRRFSINQARRARDSARFSRKISIGIALILVMILALLGWQVARQPVETGAPPESAAGNGPSLAVLPFDSLSPDPNSRYFADGVADEILTLLDRIQGLRLTSRTTTFALRDQALTVPEMAQRFSVSHVLAGAVRQIGSRVRISVQLIDARHDRQLWSESFEREVTDVFAIQKEIATAIAGALELALADPELNNRPRGTDSPVAYSRYLQGLGFFRQRSGDALPRALEVLTSAVEADPQFSEAAALLAAVYAQYNNYVSPALGNASVLGLKYAKQALSVGQENGLAHAVLGYLLGERENWLEAERHVRQSLELEPRSDLVRLWAAIHFLKLGYLQAGLDAAHAAYDLDRELGVNNSWVAIAYALNGNPTQAALFSERAAQRGHQVATLAVAENRFAPDAQSAEAAIAQVRDACCAERQLRMVWLWHPRLSAIRASAAFGEFARRIGWVEYWSAHGPPEYCGLEGEELQCAP